MKTDLRTKNTVNNYCALLLVLMLFKVSDLQAVTYTWKGGFVSSDKFDVNTETGWHYKENWEPEGVPGSNDDVIIPGNTVYHPYVYDWSDIIIGSLEIGTGSGSASLFMSCKSFSVTGNVLVGSNGTYENNGTPATYNGNFTVEAGGQYIESGYPENNGRGVASQKYWAKSVFQNSGGKIQEIRVPAGSANIGFNDLVINSSVKIFGELKMLPADCYNKRGDAVILTRNPSLTVAGTFDPQLFQVRFLPTTSASTLAPLFSVSSGGTIYVKAVTYRDNYSHSPTYLDLNSTVNYLGADQTVAALNYGNLHFAGSGTKTFDTGTTRIANAFTVANGIAADAVANNTTIDYNGTVSQNVQPINYYNLTLTNDGIKTFSNTTSIKSAFALNTTPSRVNLTSTETTIDFNGSGAQVIPGLNYSKVLLSSGGDKTVGGTVRIARELRLMQGRINTGSNKIVLDSTADIIEDESNYITGTVETTRTLSTAANSFGGIGIVITPAVNAGSTTVTRVTGHPAGQNETIARVFTIVPTNKLNNYNATIEFSYFNHELNTLGEDEYLGGLYSGTDWSLDDNSAWVQKPWSPHPYGSAQPDLNKVTYTRVNTLQRYTLGSVVTPMPVELISFTATRKGTDAELNWAVAREENNKGFEVQASNDGHTFQRIGFVESKVITSGSSQYYSFTDDRGNKQGTVYYRLKQIDLDGKSTIYAPKDVRFGAMEKTSVVAYPNPVEKEFQIALSAHQAGVATLTVQDVRGKTLLKESKQVEAGSSVLDMELPDNYRTGIYLITVELNNHKQTFKLVKK